MKDFYLGTHEPHWIAREEIVEAGGKLFLSRRRLRRLGEKTRARVPWALDSGGFTEIKEYGRWTVSPAEYVAEVRYAARLGMMEWAAPQDWMCEPEMVEQTGRTVEEHQRLTVENLLELRQLAPELPFIPVLQGYTVGDYMQCLDLYAAAGVELADEDRVGLGTVCRRQSMEVVGEIVLALGAAGIRRLHGFGVKAQGIRRYGHLLTSADSMAWSYAGRLRPDPTHRHAQCQNCIRYALAWHRDVMDAKGGGSPRPLPSPSSPSSTPPPGGSWVDAPASSPSAPPLLASVPVEDDVIHR